LSEESKYYDDQVEEEHIYHKFHRLEILGDKVKKLRNPDDFFFRLLKDCCKNVEEIIIDSILSKK